MGNIITSPYRFIYERLSLFERPVFIKFLSKKAIRNTFKDVDKAGGDVCHVFEVLTLIWDEEGGDSQRRRYNQPYPWQKNVDRTVRRRGRTGEPQSDMAMYLVYRHFKHLKLKRIYERIADMVNEFSALFSRNGSGSALSPDNVRKRIQWVKKQKDIENYVCDYENVQPIKGYNE